MQNTTALTSFGGGETGVRESQRVPFNTALGIEIIVHGKLCS